jgi:hypothetical protein
VKSGLPLMKSQRPFLILGDSLREFLQNRAASAKVSTPEGQLYCFTCKAPRAPLGMMVDCIPQTPRTARLMGLCEVCGGTCNRMVSRSKIGQFSEIFDVAMKDTTTA